MVAALRYLGTACVTVETADGGRHQVVEQPSPVSVARRKSKRLDVNRRYFPQSCDCRKCGHRIRWPKIYGAYFETRDWVNGRRVVVAKGWMCYECWLEQNPPEFDEAVHRPRTEADAISEGLRVTETGRTIKGKTRRRYLSHATGHEAPYAQCRGVNTKGKRCGELIPRANILCHKCKPKDIENPD